MKANTPKPWQSLPPAQRKKIEEHAKQIAVEQFEQDTRIMMDLYIKMVCTVLHDAFGFGEKRLTLFLLHHKRLFTRQRRMVKDNTQIEYLDRRMAEIFRKNGFPKQVFDDLLGEVKHYDD